MNAASAMALPGYRVVLPGGVIVKPIFAHPFHGWEIVKVVR